LNVAGLVNDVPETVSWVCCMMEVVVFAEDMLIPRCHPKQGGGICSVGEDCVIAEDQFPSIPLCLPAVTAKMDNLPVAVTGSLYEEVAIDKCMAITWVVSKEFAILRVDKVQLSVSTMNRIADDPESS
jgi:hypothetical protein